MRGIASIVLATGLALCAMAQVRITEAFVNPPGSPDAGREFIEIQSCRPNFSLQGYWLIGIDGENFFNPGNIHWAIDLSAYSTGSNGLLLVRDGEAVLLPEPAAETAVAVIPFAFTEAGMGNDSYTVAFVRNFTGQPGDDIDTNDDGVIDNVLWSEAVQAFGWKDDEEEPGQPDHIYPEQLNGVNIPGICAAVTMAALGNPMSLSSSRTARSSRQMRDAQRTRANSDRSRLTPRALS